MIDRVLYLDAAAEDCLATVWLNDFPVANVGLGPPHPGLHDAPMLRRVKPVQHFLENGSNELRVTLERPGPAPSTSAAPRGFARLAWFADGELVDTSKHGTRWLELAWGAAGEGTAILGRLELGEMVTFSCTKACNEGLPRRVWEGAESIDLSPRVLERVDDVMQQLERALQEGDGDRLISLCDGGFAVTLQAYPAETRSFLHEVAQQFARRAGAARVDRAALDDCIVRRVGGGRFVDVRRKSGESPILIHLEDRVIPLEYFVGWAQERLLLIR